MRVTDGGEVFWGSERTPHASRMAGIPFDSKMPFAILCALFLMAKLTVNDLQSIQGKRVLLRVDYNVPMAEQGGEMVINDTTRIKETLPTLRLLTGKGAK